MTPFSRVDVVTEADGIQSVLKAMRVFECLFKDGFSGKTIEQIHQATGIPRTTTRRLLKSFKAGGWVLERATSSGENAHIGGLSRWAIAHRANPARTGLAGEAKVNARPLIPSPPAVVTKRKGLGPNGLRTLGWDPCVSLLHPRQMSCRFALWRCAIRWLQHQYMGAPVE
ncbi:MAG: helix-turn-helix domain-containing protein [Gammaproteobacteria bacterium]